ncbi:MAG TPA: CotH kinase family protein [Polyangiales bacterium]|nr:CotH kinase family protein [Polyangiales bacterium]
MRDGLRWLGSLWVAWAVCACSDSAAPAPDHPAPDPDPPVEVLSARDVHEVRIELERSDWDTIRDEGRSLNSLYSGCVDPGFEYTWVDAQVEFDKHKLGKVRLRKKGYLGSLSANRPSLRIDVAEYAPEQRVFESKTLVLNNSLQDRSYTHQCMAYAAFAAAGVPAPRCGFARVRVNGHDLGHYVIVEPIKKPFLQRELGDDRGVLLEGNAGADFSSDRLANFEVDSGDANVSELLQPLMAALAGSGSDLRARLEGVLDLPSFLRFWAVESLIGHWDGYSGDQNNFYVYAPPGKPLQFLPWGPDGAYATDHPFLPKAGRPESVYAVGRLANRLYAVAETRELYRDTLRKLLREDWHEQALQSEIDRIARLISDADPAALDAMRSFIRNRRSQLQRELDAEATPWPFPERGSRTCREDANSELHATFDATWRELSALVPSAQSSLDVQVDGKRTAYPLVLSSAGRADNGKPSFQLVGQEAAGTLIVLQLYIGEQPIEPGEVRLQGTETLGVVVRAMSRDSYQMIGFVGDGVIQFDEVGTTAGARLRGRIDAHLVTLPAELANLMSRP